jgi:hypothetical protein
MYVSEQDAAAIYARACRAWYGSRAAYVVAAVIKKMESKGDLSGVKAWALVAAELAELGLKSRTRDDGGGFEPRLDRLRLPARKRRHSP